MRHLKRLFAIVALSTLCLSVSAKDDFGLDLESPALKPGNIFLSTKDIDLSIGGLIKLEPCFFDKVITLRRSNDDQYTFVRQKVELDLFSQYGFQKYGKSALDSFVRLSNYGYWQRENRHTPLSATNVVVTTDYTYDGLLSIDIGKHTHKTLNSLTYLEEAWLDLHLGTFLKWPSRHTLSVKGGYFPHKLGRGISFGPSPMNIEYLGWGTDELHPAENGAEETRYNHPGFLVYGDINNNIDYSLYYSHQSEVSSTIYDTKDIVNVRRYPAVPIRRGVGKDRRLFTADSNLKHNSKEWGFYKFNPYFMYLDSPENKLEFDADATSRLGTVGLMFDFYHKGWSVNAEVAGQFGHQQVYAIDRNEIIVYNDAGTLKQVYSKVLLDAAYAPVASAAVVFASDCDYKGVAQNGASDNTYTNATDRFRDEYRIDYRGYMALMDVAYMFEKHPLKVAGAAGYISGDHYPYNTEKSKRYRGFIPYGDHDYIGKDVQSWIMLYLRYVPRPTDYSTRLGYAQNNVDDTSNLQHLGASAMYQPFNNDRMIVGSNVLWFWESQAPKRYYSGAFSTQNVSKFLGTEVNFYGVYKPIDALVLRGVAGIFFPGDLYKDLEGVANENTIHYETTGFVNHGLGHAPVMIFGLSAEYKF